MEKRTIKKSKNKTSFLRKEARDAAIVSKNKWWLTEGVYIEMVGYVSNILKIVKCKQGWCIFNGDYIPVAKYIKDNDYKPIGVPFDCMPPWADEITFDRDGEFALYGHDKIGRLEAEITSFPKCPESWRGKTFPITDELKELILGKKKSCGRIATAGIEGSAICVKCGLRNDDHEDF